MQRYTAGKEPVCILGDYNQRIPRTRQPEHVARVLMDAIPAGYQIVTEGLVDAEGNSLIDHIAVSPSLHTDDLQILPRTAGDGTKLSDHVGVCANLGE